MSNRTKLGPKVEKQGRRTVVKNYLGQNYVNFRKSQRNKKAAALIEEIFCLNHRICIPKYFIRNTV